MKSKTVFLVIGLIAIAVAAWYFVIRKKPALKVTNSPIFVGGELSYTFSNFQPNESVGVHVEGGGGVNNIADSNGSGSHSFTDGDPPGNYVLVAEDKFNHKATCPFTVK
jgi:hypothetical protein